MSESRTESNGPNPTGTSSGHDDRKDWMGVLAHAELPDLEAAFAALPEPPGYRMLRGPETGLVMVQGRAGGSGTPFNMGEMTVTRCSIETDDGQVGHAYVAGRAVRHAEIAAAFDALFQHPDAGVYLRRRVLPRLTRAETRRREQRATETAATKVDFFTLVRGED